MGTRRVRQAEGTELTFSPSCRKHSHATREAAEAHRGKLYRKNRKARRGRRRIEAYYCTTCSAWHLGRDWRNKR